MSDVSGPTGDELQAAVDEAEKPRKSAADSDSSEASADPLADEDDADD